MLSTTHYKQKIALTHKFSEVQTRKIQDCHSKYSRLLVIETQQQTQQKIISSRFSAVDSQSGVDSQQYSQQILSKQQTLSTQLFEIQVSQNDLKNILSVIGSVMDYYCRSRHLTIQFVQFQLKGFFFGCNSNHYMIDHLSFSKLEICLLCICCSAPSTVIWPTV